jgi:adenylate cyclase
MSDQLPIDADSMWREYFAGSAENVDFKRMRHLFGMLPTNPRCKICHAPFQGVGGGIVKMVFHKERSRLNPRFCNACEEAARRFPGGAEVEMSVLFADIRGSTALSEKMSAKEYSQLIQRFYAAATRVIIEADGLVEKLAGDEVVAFWGAGFAGPTYVRRTVDAAQKLSAELARRRIPVGIGVHFGVAYWGSMGTDEGLHDISAKGEVLNVTARLCAKAAAGEIIISEQAIQAAGIDGSALESRNLELKGISEPVSVRVMHATEHRLPAVTA